MRTRFAAAVVASVGLAHVAVGEVNTRIDWQVSADNVHWGVAGPFPSIGSTFYARALVSYIGTAQPVGLAQMFFQPVVSNWTAADTLLPFVNNGEGGNTSTPIGVVTDPNNGTYGRVSPWGRTNLSATALLLGHVHINGSNGAPAGSWLRIAQRQVTSWIGGSANTTGGSGVPIGQRSDVGRTTADPGFNSQLQNIEVFRFAFTLGSGGFRTSMEITSPLSGFGNYNPTTGEREVQWYGSMDEGSPSIRGTVVVNSAFLVPSPGGGCVLLGAVGIWGNRRRRKD
jgi:hypothetical protein